MTSNSPAADLPIELRASIATTILGLAHQDYASETFNQSPTRPLARAGATHGYGNAHNRTPNNTVISPLHAR